MPNLGLFNYVYGIAGTGELIAQDSEIDGAGDVIAAPVAGFTGTLFAISTAGNEAIFYRSVDYGSVPASAIEVGLPAGIIDTPSIGLDWDLSGLNYTAIGNNYLMYYPAGSTLSSHEFLIYLIWDGSSPSATLEEIQIQVGNNFGGGNPTTYFTDLGAAINDSCTYTE